MMTTKEVQAVAIMEKKISPVISQAESLVIDNARTMEQAVEYLSQANKFLDAVVEDKEKLTKPINQVLKDIRAKYKPLETGLEGVISMLRSKMTRYQTDAEAKRIEDEEAIANRVGNGKGKIKVETAVRKIDELDTVESKVEGASGSVSFRKVRKFEVINVAMLPSDYIMADEVAIREAMKAGKELPGVRYYDEQVPFNSR